MGNHDILHVTTVHPRMDIRITVKELYSASSLSRWKVGLLVADGVGDSLDTEFGVTVEDIGQPIGGRTGRLFIGFWKALSKICSLRPRLIHFHDPELIPLGLVLKCLGYQVIYDVHEDVPRQIMYKLWIPKIMRSIIAGVMECVEWFAAVVFDNIVAATPKIAQRFPAHKTVVIQNFPRLEEFGSNNALAYSKRSPAFAYVGGITDSRGAQEMIKAINSLSEDVDYRLELAGSFSESALQRDLQSMPGWSRVRFHGWASRSEVADILSSVRAGLLVLHPLRNYLDSYPIKLFEYMASSLPVIASDFPLWRQIIGEVNCGLFIDPLNPRAISDAMQWILENPTEAEAMGRRGRRAVEQYYNWGTEETKLIELYDLVLKGNMSIHKHER